MQVVDIRDEKVVALRFFDKLVPLLWDHDEQCVPDIRMVRFARSRDVAKPKDVIPSGKISCILSHNAVPLLPSVVWSCIFVRILYHLINYYDYGPE
jgi:hypothetical protein